MAELNSKPKTIVWINFPNGEAKVKRLIWQDGTAGVMMAVGQSSRREEILEISTRHGFTPVGSRGAMRWLKTDPQPLNLVAFMREMESKIGAELVVVSREDMRSEKYTTSLVKRAPRGAEKTPDGPKIPDPETVTSIGLNLRGEEVVRDGDGRFFRRISNEDGVQSFVHESEGGQPALFLRAVRKEDFDGIAAGLIMMARRGTLHLEDFDRVTDAAIETGPRGKVDISREDAQEYLRRSMLRQITSIGLEGEADRAAFMRAIRIGTATDFVLSRKSEQGADFRPSSAMLTLIRRLTQGYDKVSLIGGKDLEIAVPRQRDDSAALQVMDLSSLDAGSVPNFITNAMARRPDEGASMIIIPERFGQEVSDRIRSDIGRFYGLEAVSDVTSGVADGVRGGQGYQIFFAGDRRPEPIEALPQAALRTFGVVTVDDLPSLEREVTRARARLREFNRGEAQIAEERAEV